MNNGYRVYNHTDRELIVATDDEGKQQYRLLAQSASPLGVAPRLVWAASGEEIDNAVVWRMTGGFDVHISETGTDTSIGAAAPLLANPLAASANLHISGLGIEPHEGPVPASAATEAWFYREDELWVTVLGAGITGLTAAHELVTRGFRVQVIERAHGSPADPVDVRRATWQPTDAREAADPLGRFRRGLSSPDVGGIARTQWGTQPLARADAGGIIRAQSAPVDAPILPPGAGGPQAVTPGADELKALRSVHGDGLWFGADAVGAQHSGGYHVFGVPWSAGKLDQPDKLAGDLRTWLHDLTTEHGRSVAGVQLVVVAYGDPDGASRGYRRLDELLAQLSPPAGSDGRSPTITDLCTTLAYLQVLPTARIDVAEPEPGAVPAAAAPASPAPASPAPGAAIPAAPAPAVPAPYVGLLVRVHEDLGLIAGEHGFRFFPGFYRHLRDTMRRTPIFDRVTGSFTARTALDNLEQVNWQVIVEPGRRHQAALSRTSFASLGGMIEQYRALRRDTGYRPSDLLRYLLRIVRYMTSSVQRRRKHYQDISWWEFLSKRQLDDPGDKATLPYGVRFEQALRETPKALIAMGSEFADARTIGNVSVQLLMDQLDLHDQSDATLIGPTSTTWLAHWRTYLEQQGVTFFLGEVTEIAAPEAGPGARTRVRITWPTGAPPATYLDGEARKREGEIAEHYVVSALDIVSLARVTQALRARDDADALSGIDELLDGRDDPRELEDLTKVGQLGDQHGLDDRFQTLTGLQLYYKRHVSFANGHIYFAGSPWGLSAISQVQFWGPFGSGHRGRLTGNLSIDIGSWRSGHSVPSPNVLTRDEIALAVQHQITQGTPEAQRALQRAMLYHLDDFIGFGPARSGRGLLPTRNHAPFLINLVGDWDTRPIGEPWSPNDAMQRNRVPGAGRQAAGAWVSNHGGYPVHFQNLVIAGTHLRTFTRMGTMEAANESARHAVNAILDHATGSWRQSHADELAREDAMTPYKAERSVNINVDRNTTRYGDYCEIWNPEMFEIKDLQFMRSIDDHLMQAHERTSDDDAPPGTRPRRAPHLFDILRIDELPDHLDDDREAVHALELIGSILAAFDGARADDLPSVFAVLDGARKKLAGLFKRG